MKRIVTFLMAIISIAAVVPANACYLIYADEPECDFE